MFWKLGNSFDTMIDFLDTINSGSAGEVARMAVTQLQASLGHIKGGIRWGVVRRLWVVEHRYLASTAKAAFFKPEAERLQEILDQCWPRFTSDAPCVWQRRRPGTFVSVRRTARREGLDGERAGQAAAAVRGEVAQAQGRRSSIRLIGCSAIRARTSRR